jgi:hypothetical protein
VADLRERAASEPYTTEQLPTSDDEGTILAGRAIDLSGSLDCLGWECIQKNVDELFNRIWHYFDRIVVVGASAHQIPQEFESEARVPLHLPAYIRLLLYLREIGAERFLLFRQKPPACTEHLKQHLAEVGIQNLENDAESVVPSLASEGIIKTSIHDSHIHYAFSHPEFEHTVWGSVSNDIEGDLSEAVARSVVRRYLAALVSDLRTARMLNCPLGSSVRFHERLLAENKPIFGADDVAFSLELPIVQGLDLRTLLKLRTDERPAFDRFRRALATAIKEKLSTDGQSDPRRIAKEIRKDVLEPALSEIELRLRATADSLRKKDRSRDGNLRGPRNIRHAHDESLVYRNWSQCRG